MLIMISLCCYLGIERITYTCKIDNHGINGKKILRRKHFRFADMELVTNRPLAIIVI